MIQSFADTRCKQFFREGLTPASWRSFSKAAIRKLDMLDGAVSLGDLRSPPGNRLEALKGDRAGQFSIRINDQWRVCFRWTDNGPADVTIIDYHREDICDASREDPPG